jgi:hypothetical protein
VTEIELEVQQAISNLGLSPDRARQCDPDTAGRIVKRAEATFVAERSSIWWHSLRHPAEYFEYPDSSGHKHVAEHAPVGEKDCWFIPETEGPSLPVFDVELAVIEQILDECQLFEYYLVGKRCDWLIVENDHNQIIRVRLPGEMA